MTDGRFAVMLLGAEWNWDSACNDDFCSIRILGNERE